MTRLIVLLLALSPGLLFAQFNRLGGKQLCPESGGGKNCVLSTDKNGNAAVPVTVLGPRTIGAGANQLPAAASCVRCLTVVTDAATTSDCTVGSGNAHAVCYSDGITWGPLGGSGVSGTLPVTVATVSPQAVAQTGFFFNNAAGAMTFNLPAITTATVGNQYCFRNYTGRTGAITLQLPAATSVDVDGVNGTAAGTLVSGGALGDSACVVAVAVGQYMAYIGTGVWTNN